MSTLLLVCGPQIRIRLGAVAAVVGPAAAAGGASHHVECHTVLHDGCLLSMQVGAGLGTARPPCPLGATLFGLFIHGLHHYLETVVPGAGFQIQHMRRRKLVY